MRDINIAADIDQAVQLDPCQYRVAYDFQEPADAGEVRGDQRP